MGKAARQIKKKQRDGRAPSGSPTISPILSTISGSTTSQEPSPLLTALQSNQTVPVEDAAAGSVADRKSIPAASCDVAMWLDELPPPAMPLDGDVDALGLGFELDDIV